MTSLYNKEAKAEYLTGSGSHYLFRYTCDGELLSSSGGNWKLDAYAVRDVMVYGKAWGKSLEVCLSGKQAAGGLSVKLVFEIYDGRSGLRYQTYVRNNDLLHAKLISASDIIGLNFPNDPHTLHYVPLLTRWESTRGGAAALKRNAVCVYDTGHGWCLNSENNWATSLSGGAMNASCDNPFLKMDIWHGNNDVTVYTDTEAVQLELFPGEEMEYFAVNVEVFKGDQWDGRVAVSEHLRKRYKFHDPSRVLSINDWQWFSSKDCPRTERNYRHVCIPKVREAGFDQINVDDYWNHYHGDTTNCVESFTSDLPALAAHINGQGLKFGIWFSPTGGFFGAPRDLADPATIEIKRRQQEHVLIPQYRSTWDQIDLGIFWKEESATWYSHPSDSVYRKVIKARAYMNDIAHRYPDYMMQTTCEVDNMLIKVGEPQSVGLLHLPDNGIAGMFMRTSDRDNVKDMFNLIGSFPLEGSLATFGADGVGPDAWQTNVGWYYSFLLARHTSLYSKPNTWDDNGVSVVRAFNEWRKNSRIKALLNELVRPVYDGQNDDNEGPYAWMFVNDAKSSGLLLAIGGSNTTANTFSASLRWLDSEKVYLILDISMNNDGGFHYAFKGKYNGGQLKNEGFLVDLGEHADRAKAYWIQELHGTGSQVLYADYKVTAYTQRLSRSKLIVRVTGEPGCSAFVAVYKDGVGGAEFKAVAIGADGQGSAAFANDGRISAATEWAKHAAGPDPAPVAAPKPMPGKMVDDTSPDIVYSGVWEADSRLGPYESTRHYSDAAGSSAALVFRGASIALYGCKAADKGIADVHIDGRFIRSVDAYSADERQFQRLFYFAGLAEGEHTIKVVVTGRKNADATGCFTEVDAFEINPD